MIHRSTLKLVLNPQKVGLAIFVGLRITSHKCDLLKPLLAIPKNAGQEARGSSEEGHLEARWVFYRKTGAGAVDVDLRDQVENLTPTGIYWLLKDAQNEENKNT